MYARDTEVDVLIWIRTALLHRSLSNRRHPNLLARVARGQITHHYERHRGINDLRQAISYGPFLFGRVVAGLLPDKVVGVPVWPVVVALAAVPGLVLPVCGRCSP